MKIQKIDLIIGAFFTLFFAFFLSRLDNFVYGGIQGSISPTLFPKIIVGVIIFLGLVMVSTNMFAKRKKVVIKEEINPERINATKEVTDERSTKKIVIYIIFLFAYLFLLYVFGFIISTPLVMFCTMLLLGGRNLKLMLPLIIISPLILYYACYKFLKVMLPQGLIFG